jgi:flavorubredoxin
MSRWKPGGVLEVVPNQLFAVGAPLPFDGRASWNPDSAVGYQPWNVYLLRGESDVIIDTGVAALRDPIMQGLGKLLAREAPVRVFLTRSQLDCIGNLGALASTYKLVDVFTGGVRNPFDQFDAATSTDERARGIGVARSLENPPLEIFTTPLRLLATYWGYDEVTRTLFTSDAFAHCTIADPDATPLLDTVTADSVHRSQVRDHLIAAFWWLPVANTTAIANHLRTFFATHEVEIIAPNRGCVLRGKDIVDRHIAMILDVLSEETETEA